jgi:SH3 domain-containing YSC84-like protein 1
VRLQVHSPNPGISIEGSVIIERKEANSNFYNRMIHAKEILSGVVPQPPEADCLYRALDTRIAACDFGPPPTHGSQCRKGSFVPPPSYTSGQQSSSQTLSNSSSDAKGEQIWIAPDEVKQVYSPSQSQSFQPISQSQTTYPSMQAQNPAEVNPWKSQSQAPQSQTTRPVPPHPPRHLLTAVALYDYTPQADGDLAFTEGDVISVLEMRNEWWKGTCNGRTGEVFLG